MRDSAVPRDSAAVPPEGAPRWISSPVTLHAVQCARCLKWRIIPTKEQYEAIREHILEKPWVCESASNWRSELHCDLPADIIQDRSMLWAIDKPNLPSAPAGWERQITVRTDGSSKFADVYYTAPSGARLRSKVEIEKYIAKHPDSVPPKTTMDQFSFAIPRPLPGVCPQLTPNGKKLTLPQAAHEVHNEQEQLTPQSVDNVPQGDDQAAVPHSDTLLLPSVDQGGPISGNGNVQLLTQVTLPSPQRPQPSKRSHPESPVMTPTRRTKQQVKKDRLGQESLVVSEADEQPPPDASTSSGYAESP